MMGKNHLWAAVVVDPEVVSVPACISCCCKGYKEQEQDQAHRKESLALLRAKKIASISHYTAFVATPTLLEFAAPVAASKSQILVGGPTHCEIGDLQLVEVAVKHCHDHQYPH